jgi:hypothetical protein
MKKLIFTTAIFLGFISVLFAGKVEKEYLFSSPTVRTSAEYSEISFPNALLTGLPGEPRLPYMQVKLLLPPGEAAVGIEIFGSDEIVIPGSFTLAPQQNVQPVSKGSTGDFIRNDQVYQSDQMYPVNLGGKLITSYLIGHSFALSTFTPVRYIPSTGSVSYYSRIKVVITTATSQQASTALANLKQDEGNTAYLNSFADNPDQLNSYITDQNISTDDYEILIITTSEFNSGFENLRAAYLTEGLKSQVVTTDYISSNMTGIDLQEKMRNYIIQEYQQHNLQHVILGGDDELVPHRGFFCHVQSSSVYEDYDIPADLYYSGLDGNWNTDGDDKWAEPGEEDDLLPDISVGRMSFSNMAELQRMLHKSYAYQFTPVAGEFQKVLMPGENLYNDPITWGSDYLELLVGAHDDNGYLTSGIPVNYALNRMYDENNEWNTNDLINQINQGYPMLNHVGHANQTYVMKLSNWDITDQNFYNANGVNHNYTIVYTHGCDCGSFDYNDCIAEAMVSINNFAAAFIGNSRYGWFNEGQTEGPSAHLHREYMDALFTDRLNRIGRAHMQSKRATAPWVTAPGQWEPGAIRWCFYDCNVLGDPVMAVWTNNALDITTTYPSSVPLWSSNMNVNVASNGFGVVGLNCVLLQNGNMLGKGITDESGNALISFDHPLNTLGTASLVVSGYNCLPTTYSIIIDPATGMEKPQASLKRVSVGPNPADQDISLHFELVSGESVSVQLISTDGKLKSLLEPVYLEGGKHSIKRSIADLPSGIYTCLIRTGNQTENTRFIKK